MNEDAEIVQEFLVESHENLDQLDRDLVELERNPGSHDLLSSIFRAIHTIKGTSGFLAFGRLEQLTHVGENLLSKLRDGELELREDVAEVLLRMVDTVRALLELIERTETDDGDVDVAPVVAAITAVMEREPALPAVADDLDVVGDPVTVPSSPAAGSEPPSDGDLDPARRTVVDSSVRVDVDLLDSLVQLVGELVLTRNQILQKADALQDGELARATQRLNLVASELQEGVMRTRMQPIGQIWSKMPRIVRDLAHQLGREVDLQLEGHDTELDRSLLEAIKGPLTHLVRNALDHGIEPAADRIAGGKAAAGRLILRASHESGQVVVEISDDGKGIDPERIAAVAVDRGVVSADALRRMDQREVVNLIFTPGFSTAGTVTNVSGRGVGMDVVRTNIERIGGSVDIASQPGVGTTCRVRIPLTLAIIPALLVGENHERYAIPQANLVELVRLEGEDLRRSVEVLAGAPVLRLRGQLLPLLSLSSVLGLGEPETGAITVVVLQSEDVRFGLAVAEVHDTQEIVVKPIGRQLKGQAIYAGATVMGDGRVSLILDIPGIARTYGMDTAGPRPAEVRSVTEDQSSLLVLELAGGRRAALPLGDVSRLEEFRRDQVEASGDTEVVQYRDGILPLVRLAPAIGLTEADADRDELAVVVFERQHRRIGIVIDRVVDVVDVVVTASEVGRRPGVLGSAVVQDKVTDLVDLDAVVLAGRAG